MVRANYENSVASLLNQIESHRERLDALRLDDTKANEQTRVNETSDLSFTEIARNALNEVCLLYTSPSPRD